MRDPVFGKLHYSCGRHGTLIVLDYERCGA